jgi:5-amino-6-(5-phospho-D-ribitylamino)uracil phosphatase
MRSVIRLLAIDIDGTLLDSRGQLPDAHRDAVAAAAAAGVEIALVTGRSFHFARPIADLLPAARTLIVNNGAVVKDRTGASLLRRVLPRDIARRVLDGTRAFEDSVALVFDRDGGAPSASSPIVYDRMDWSHANRRGYYAKNQTFIAAAPGPLAEALTDDPIQVMFNGGVAPMRALTAALRALPIADRISVAVTEYERRDFSLVDVNAAGCSKGSTLARWTEARGWTRDEVAAFGDNLNDVEMLDFAGTAVVMGNATEALKARGYRVTASSDEGGLASAIADIVRSRTTAGERS